MRVLTAALTSILAVTFMGRAVVSKAAKDETAAERVTVNRDGVPVYSHMATSGIVVMQLMRGDVVEIETADTTSEGTWCRVREIAIWGRSGYVRCTELKGEGTPSEIPPKAAAPPTGEAPPGAKGQPEASRPPEAPVSKATPPMTGRKVTNGRSYTVQVAALVAQPNAQSLTKRLEKLGYRPRIQTTTARITRHRVYAGEFESQEEAQQAARRLNVDGFSSNLVEVEGGKFVLEVGSFFKIDEAIDLARDLQNKNYISRIDSTAIPTQVHVVRVGAYENHSEALQTLDALKKQGFSPLIVRE